MRRSLQLLFATCVLAASTLVVYALDSGSATPTTSATTEFQKLIADTKNEWAKAKSETEKAHKDFETAKSGNQPETLAVTKRALDAAEAKLLSIQQKLTVLERAETAFNGTRAPAKVGTANFRIAGANDSGEYFDGRINDVGVWSGVLSASQIQSAMRADLANVGANPIRKNG